MQAGRAHVVGYGSGSDLSHGCGTGSGSCSSAKWCKTATQHRDTPCLHFEPRRLYLASAGLYSSILSLNSCLFSLLRIRIRLPRMMRIHAADQNPPLKKFRILEYDRPEAVLRIQIHCIRVWVQISCFFLKGEVSQRTCSYSYYEISWFFFEGGVSGFGSGSTDTSEISPENYRSFKKNLGLCTKRKKLDQALFAM